SVLPDRLHLVVLKLLAEVLVLGGDPELRPFEEDLGQVDHPGLDLFLDGLAGCGIRDGYGLLEPDATHLPVKPVSRMVRIVPSLLAEDLETLDLVRPVAPVHVDPGGLEKPVELHNSLD